ncbi:amidohydrolase family protein [Sinanaerobacter sp. ZZT-01]|uniref:amidohydrolase family protein n=1 Tax=Sinanaerobacter sp. ZZT-01 TaxID=3111540 RepID=UPI002D771E5A|nr:amidohydrolase family protein [Sinanaerobacter sp. ZZT-01]WRR94589.1 amidohydrolase family protein [Sinanaerobacter sp. ZZT-01]
MKKIDLMILAEHMYTMEGEGVGYLANSGVAINGGKIIAVAPSEQLKKEYEAEKLITVGDKVLMPGFIDGHLHSGHGVLRGVAQDINNWMMHGMAPFEAQRSYEAKNGGSRLAIAEAIMNGTTTIGDDGTEMEGACQFIKDCGVRGNISIRIREALQRVYKPGELYEYDENYGQKTLCECLNLFDQFNDVDNGRIKIRFGPQGPDFVSEATLMKVKKMAKERKSKIHMHLSQGSRETKQMMMRYGKKGIPWLAEKDYFDCDFIGIHLTDATPEEVKLFSKTGAKMILCSSSIAIIDGVVPPAKQFQDAGGICGLGSDQASGNNCHNMINEMKMTAILNKVHYENPEVMPAWKVVRMATIENAQALGIDHITGSIKEGKDADLILVDLKQASLTPLYTKPIRNFIPNLVYSARGNEVDTIIVKGRILVENKTAITFNMEDILREAQAFADEIGERATPQFIDINGKNVQYMKEQKL